MVETEVERVASPAINPSLPIRGNGDMADRIRTHAWNETALGSISEWPPELLAIVNLMLSSREIMTVFWGPDRLMLYNDPYVPQLGSRHPALGLPLREVWPDVVDQVASLIDPAFDEGRASYLDDTPISVLDGGRKTLRYYTASFEPIWIRQDGSLRVGGVFQTAINNTARIEAEEKRKRAEQERDKERTSLRLAQEVAEIVSWEWDVKSGDLAWIGNTLPLFGRPAAQLSTAEAAIACVHKDDVAAVQAALGPLMQGKGEIHYEHRVVHPDGTVRWMAARGRALLSEAGEVHTIVGANSDITKAKEAQLVDARTAEQLSLAIAGADLGMWLFDQGTNHLTGDRRTGDLFGLDAATGSPELWISKIHPADQARVAAEFAAASKGKPYDTEFRIVQGDLTRWIRARAREVGWQQSNSLIGVCEDITQQKRAEALLQSTAERLHLAQAAGHITSWDWDIESGTILWTESEWAWGRAPEELVSAEACFALVHPEDLPILQQTLDPLRQGAAESQYEFRVLWPDGNYHWLAGRGQSVGFTAEGQPTRLIGVNVDITERKLAEAALLQNEKLAAVGRLASSIAHEINNPLESVTNLIFLAKSAPEVSEETQDYLDTADRELRRASNIVSQTLRFHKQSTAPTKCSGKTLFQGILSIYQGRLVNSHIEVDEHYTEGPEVECLEGDIRQVLSNLVVNAIDAMPKGGRLILRGRAAKNPKTGAEGIKLVVADTGFGMPEAVRRKVFEAFYSTKGIGGTGLGLWISKEIVDRHHGTLRVRSSQGAVRSGTVFTLFLPHA